MRLGIAEPSLSQTFLKLPWPKATPGEVSRSLSTDPKALRPRVPKVVTLKIDRKRQ